MVQFVIKSGHRNVYHWFSVSFLGVDAEAPVFENCSFHQSINNDPGKPSALATWTNPTATDNTEGIPQVTCYPESGTDFFIGVTSVTCHAKSINGHVATCDFEIVVTGRFITLIFFIFSTLNMQCKCLRMSHGFI